MKNSFHYQQIPRSRIATFDTASIGLQKHHISALLEFDVTDARKLLQELRRNGTNISFNAWLIKVISHVLGQHKEACGYLYSKKKLIIFEDINISIIVEKKVGAMKVPVPLVIEKTNEKSAVEITDETEKAKNQDLSDSDIVLNKKTSFLENLYYHLPGFIRRNIWRAMLRNPEFVFKKMGNAIITSVGMMGKINGWFIHRSVHPVSFGIGSVLKKPVAVNNEIVIREILNMTILVDHDVIDGAPMVRFLNDLTRAIETGQEIKNMNS
jgi:pyruvate/2-oxoglutarate dehydrogenase complex dihydrolipoamide acyltransferase (E2) component